MTVLRRLVPVLGVLIVTGQLTSAAPAGASAADISPPRAVSGRDPLPKTCNPKAEPDGDREWERQPSLAVNAANRKNLVTAWRQDLSDGIVAGWSKDGGHSWSQVVVPQKFCTSDATTDDPKVQEYLSAADPWVSFGPDGTAYLAAVISGPGVNTASTGATIVNTSRDGGQTWGGPVILDDVGYAFDRTTMIADPVRPGRAYVAWDKALNSTSTARPYVTATTDGGATWDPPQLIYNPPTPGNVSAINQLLVLPDHSLVAILNEHTIPTDEGPTTLLSTKSPDGGRTWSDPVKIAEANGHGKTGQQNTIHVPVFASGAVSQDGTIHVAWQTTDRENPDDPSSTKITSIKHAASHDGGSNWQQTPGAVATLRGLPPDTTPKLSVGNDGTVAVLFNDHRNNVANPPKVTDVWLRHSHDGGATWNEDHVAGPFDARANGKKRLGTYQGIAPTGDGFALAYVLGPPLPGATFTLTDPPTGIFYSKVAS